jgi:hypothetical protein
MISEIWHKTLVQNATGIYLLLATYSLLDQRSQFTRACVLKRLQVKQVAAIWDHNIWQL